jgi:colanic acid/amylovoran biosynthesis glycosyltransferase
MHVKLVVNAFPVASETFLFNLVTSLEARGVKMTVVAISPHSNRDLYSDRLSEWSGNLDVIPFDAGIVRRAQATVSAAVKRPGAARQAVARFGIRKGSNMLLRAHHLMNDQPDIIHFAYSGTAIAYLDALSVLANHGKKLFISCRGSAEKVKPITNPHRADQLRRLFETVHRVHCVSQDMMDGLLEHGLRREQAFVNYPSIDVDAFRRPTPYDASAKDVWQIVSTGRLHFQKGYMFALLALRLLKQRGVRFQYHMMGEGPDREMLMYVIRQLDLQDAVVMHGRVSGADVKRALLGADLFLLPSLYEGIANAALEAMAMELPIVTTTAGGMNEVIEHGVNGMIVDRFDPDAIAASIETLLGSGELRRTIGAKGRETVQRTFVLSRQIDTFYNEYQRALS